MTEPYLFTDPEAAALLAWAKRQPRHPEATFAGVDSAACAVGVTRQHLSCVLRRDPRKRKPAGPETFGPLLEAVQRDPAALAALRRVASDDVHRALDDSIRAAAERAAFVARIDLGGGEALFRVVPV